MRLYIVDTNKAIKILLMCCVNSTDQIMEIHNDLIINSIVGYAKRGTITTNTCKAKRIRDDIELESGIEVITLSVQAISKFHRFMSQHINENDAPLLFQHIHSQLSDISLRLKLTLEQAKYSGLTYLIIIFNN